MAGKTLFRELQTEPTEQQVSPVGVGEDGSIDAGTAWYIGVDEAGYGPNLGPLVVVATAFRGPVSIASADWWELLRPSVGRVASRSRLVIDDSKLVHAGPEGDARLARAVRLLLALCGVIEGDLQEDFAQVAPSDLPDLLQEHWFANGTRYSDAVLPPIDAIDEMRGEWRRLGLVARTPAARVLFPGAFNRCLTELGNKARVESDLVGDLIRTQLTRVPAGCDRVFVDVDRLGGRRYYRPLVESFADGFVLTIEETTRRSAYRYECDGIEVDVQFRVQADRSSLPVAAASMIAKRLRERCMSAFNAYWCGEMEGLTPTAGYPVDARRFLSVIEPHLERLGVGMESLWRQK